MEGTSFLTRERAFWAHVYLCYIIGLGTLVSGGVIAYKQFIVGRTTVLIGSVDTYDDGSTDEGKIFTKRKG